ncbi:sodium-dependent transporter [Mammaliicoccus stepanovicii]|uniref:Sodium/neurotransmitter symporter family protein n=1 Tax=Mammaliicoccus stepanovicii TaxID=643214 RepID=A0A239YA19_9STAP|nr:sodium-dependent transporter [Mammaliicoccus stepanovicii]PNZ75490.1 sodium-dependent transporter [Mammaliicoccus stepanovicii]GGI42519.1 transporter [Mammaliicoccus stepanovicii]SNV56101.1 Sodium/neurotransmitter symporter family protein [Mammaliicoccus stepanovicii]
MSKQREEWSSKLGFIMASAGAAIGIGAIWKFPYVAGQFGGGAFLLLFIIFTLFIGLPMLISEFIIGRSVNKEAVSAYDTLAPKSPWRITGRLGVIGCFLLLTFYSVVGGWITIYTAMGLTGQIISDDANYGKMFEQIISQPFTILLGTFVFILLNVIVLSFGIKKGIERANNVLMPLLFIFFIILVVRAVTLEGASEGLSFFFSFNFSDFNAEGVLYALGQSFFSLAVGFSCMVTYSSYLSKQESLPTSAASVTGMNIIVSILAGMAIFPVVYAFSLEPTAGPGLLFIVLPNVFSQMAFGSLFLTLFLLLFLFATLTSSFSQFEIIISAIEKDKKRSRPKVVVIIGLLTFIACIPSSLSSGVLAHVDIFGKSIFDATDYLVSNILLPIGCLLIAVFISFRMDKALVKSEFQRGNTLSLKWFKLWKFLMRYIIPIIIIIVFIFSL